MVHHYNKNELDVKCQQPTGHHYVWLSCGIMRLGPTGPELDKLRATDKQNCLAQGGY